MKIHPSRLRHRSAGTVAFALLAALLLAALLPAAASARYRTYEGSFGYFKPVFGSNNPNALAVDQSNGDVYVVSHSIEPPEGSLEGAIPTVSRFTAAGLPKTSPLARMRGPTLYRLS